MAIPVITSGSSDSSSPGSVTLSATVNPQSLDTSVYFTWTNAGGQSAGTTPTQDVGAGAADVSVVASLTNLIPGATYSLQVVATNASGTAYGYGTVDVYASPFVALLQGSTAPWDDPQDGWKAYQAALGGMVEPVYDIVADRGEPDEPQIARLAQPIVAGVTITNIFVTNLSLPLPTNTVIKASSASTLARESFTTSGTVALGASTIPIAQITPDDDLAVGDPVVMGYVPGWSSLLHVETCPDQFLPYLAQFNGTDIPLGLDAVAARQRIKAEGGRDRGTLGAVTSAVKRNLSGTQYVVIMERLDALGNLDAYHFLVIVRPGEVLSVSALTDDVNATKPGGVMWTLIQTDGWTISQMEASQPTLSALEANFATLTGLEGDRPGT